LVVTDSRYSICSATLLFCIPADSVADISEFLAIISSDTWFIRESSFSVSTRIVLDTTGLPAGFLASAVLFASACLALGAGAGVAAAGAGAAGAAGAGAAGAGASAAGAAAGASGSNSPISTDSISDTFLAISATFSGSSVSVTTIRENVNSNFSSSIS
jgi:hypothetical protein